MSDGALIADLLFSFFGRPAYLFTVMVFYLGWMLYREQKTQHLLTRVDYTLRIGGFVATLVTSCALATLHFSPEGFNQTAGGIIGQIVGLRLAAVMKLLGASALLFVIWVASVSLFLGISWFNVMDRIGRVCLLGYERARAKIGEMRDRAEGRRKFAERQDLVEVEKKRTAGRAPPRIEPVMAALERADEKGPGEDYIYIEWGPGFYAQHAQSYPDLEGSAQIANIGWLGIQLALTNGGSCFLPARMAAPFVASGHLHRVAESPEYVHPAYMVFPRSSDSAVLAQALEGLRELAAAERKRVARG